jgi:hypothetical protein
MYSIYKLSSCETDEVYIGITKTKLNHRLAKHKNHYKRYTNGTGHWISAYHISKYLDVKIELIEETEDKTRERFYIENTENCINEKIPTRTQKEYVEANKEKTNIYQKEYRESHKEKMSEYKKKHYKEKAGVDVMCECGRTFKKKHEKRHKAGKIHLDLINGVKKETPEERKAKYNANRRAKYALKQ